MSIQPESETEIQRDYQWGPINFINDEAVGSWVGAHHCPHLCGRLDFVGECLHTSIITETPLPTVHVHTEALYTNVHLCRSYSFRKLYFTM